MNSCSCPSTFSFVKVGEGKYKLGKSNQIIFVRILRNHVMVRVGGGWDTLEHFIQKHDPCQTRVGGFVNRKGDTDKLASAKLSAIMDFNSDAGSVCSSGAKLNTLMDFNSDGGSVCSSESFGSCEGGPISSVSPDSDGGSSYWSVGPSISRQSSIVLDSEGEDAFRPSRSVPDVVKPSISEPTIAEAEKPNEADECISKSKSATFTKFGPRKMSLLSTNLKESDVYLNKNPSDNWLRKHLDTQKQAVKNTEGKEKVSEKGAEKVTEKVTEKTSSDKMTVESIKRKYGRPVKPERVLKKEVDESPAGHRRSLTNPNSKVIPADNMKRLQMGTKKNPQYRSWDQSMSTPMKRKEKPPGTKEPSDLVSNGKSASSDTQSERRKSSVTPRARPSFTKAHTADSATMKPKRTPHRDRSSKARTTDSESPKPKRVQRRESLSSKAPTTDTDSMKPKRVQRRESLSSKTHTTDAGSMKPKQTQRREGTPSKAPIGDNAAMKPKGNQRKGAASSKVQINVSDVMKPKGMQRKEDTSSKAHLSDNSAMNAKEVPLREDKSSKHLVAGSDIMKPTEILSRADISSKFHINDIDAMKPKEFSRREDTSSKPNITNNDTIKPAETQLGEDKSSKPPVVGIDTMKLHEVPNGKDTSSDPYMADSDIMKENEVPCGEDTPSNPNMAGSDALKLTEFPYRKDASPQESSAKVDVSANSSVACTKSRSRLPLAVSGKTSGKSLVTTNGSSGEILTRTSSHTRNPVMRSSSRELNSSPSNTEA